MEECPVNKYADFDGYFKKSELPKNSSYIVAKYNGRKWEMLSSYRENHTHASASMIKVLILTALINSDFDYGELMKVKQELKVGGGGALQEINEEIELSLLDLARLMITLSDNTATNLLIEKLGFDVINKEADRLNLKATVLQRKMMDFEAARAGRENFMSVQDYYVLMTNIYNNRFLPRYEDAWDILARQQFRDCLPAFWPEEVIFHHKTGELDGVVHDGGIAEKGKEAYALICFSSQGANNFATKYEMAKFGAAIYRVLDLGKYYIVKE